MLFILFATLSGALSWILIAPTGDILIYQESYDVVWLEGLIAFATNVISALAIGLPIIFGLKYVRIPYSIVKRNEE